MGGNFYNLDAERSVIAAMFKKGVAEKHLARLTPEDFYELLHKRVYMAMQALYILKKPITLPLMDEMLTKQNGTSEYMIPLITIVRENSFSAEFVVDEHIRIIKDCSKRRGLFDLLNNSLVELKNPTCECDAIAANVAGCIRGMKESKGGTVTLSTVLLNAFTDLEERAQGKRLGMPSGIDILDRLTAGFHRGEMTIIGARPAVGKSALACQIAIGAASNGHKVCVLSREMTDVQYGVRILSRGTKVSNMRMRTGALSEQDWLELSESASMYNDCDIGFLFDVKYIEDLVAEAQAMKENGGLDMLIVDYIQLLMTKQKTDKDYVRIGIISKALKDLSTELNIAVIALAQVGRNADNSMPALSELRGSGDLEQDADNVIFIHRPESPDDKWVKPDDRGVYNAVRMMKNQYIVLNVAKQRQGETGAVSCIFNPSAMTYSGVVRE